MGKILIAVQNCMFRMSHITIIIAANTLKFIAHVADSGWFNGNFSRIFFLCIVFACENFSLLLSNMVVSNNWWIYPILLCLWWIHLLWGIYILFVRNFQKYIIIVKSLEGTIIMLVRNLSICEEFSETTYLDLLERFIVIMLVRNSSICEEFIYLWGIQKHRHDSEFFWNGIYYICEEFI